MSFIKPVFNGDLSILWNFSLQWAALDLPQGLSCNVPWSSICLFHTALSKTRRAIKSQWRVWKSASVEIILIDPKDPIQEDWNRMFCYLSSSAWYRAKYCESEKRIHSSYVLDLEVVRVHENNKCWRKILSWHPYNYYCSFTLHKELNERQFEIFLLWVLLIYFKSFVSTLKMLWVGRWLFNTSWSAEQHCKLREASKEGEKRLAHFKYLHWKTTWARLD